MNRYNWIDGLRGGACVVVYLQHFTLAFANNMLYDNGCFRIKPLAFMFNGNFAVCLFLIISFYLTSKNILTKNVTSRDIGLMSVKRYMRLTIPIIIVCLFVILIQLTFGFYNQEVSTIDNNTWFDDYY